MGESREEVGSSGWSSGLAAPLTQSLMLVSFFLNPNRSRSNAEMGAFA